MAQPNFADYYPAQNSGHSVKADEIQSKILECLAALASGQNPDGSTLTISVTNPTSKTSVYPNAPANIPAAITDTALTAANTSRTGLIISNDSTSKLYVLIDVLGSGAASTSDFNYVVQPGNTLELPIVGGSVPTARIRGIWLQANGSAGITDIS